MVGCFLVVGAAAGGGLIYVSFQYHVRTYVRSLRIYIYSILFPLDGGWSIYFGKQKQE